MTIDRRRFTQLCAGSLALGAVGCGRSRDRAYSRGPTVVVRYCCDKAVLAPEPFDMPAKFLVFLPLLTEDADGNLEGRLARSWEHSSDYRKWTYHLRTDVTWDDGIPVTARDVKFSVDVLRHPEVAYAGVAGIESVTVIDDWTVAIRGSEFREMNSWVTFFPEHLLAARDPRHVYEWDFWTQPVGNGPYRFVRYLPETLMEFQARSDYFRGKPKVDRVVLKFSGASGLTELLSGDVDAIPDLDPAWIPKLAADPRFRIYHHWGTGARAIYWRVDHPLLRDASVRRAFTHAINRRELLSVMNLPRDLRIFDGPYTWGQLRRGEFPEPLPYDPALASRLLDAAGWRDVHGEGVRYRDGRPFRFTALIRGASTGYDPGLEAAAVYVQEQLRRVGVSMALRRMQPGQERSVIRSGDYAAAFTIHGNKAGWIKRYFGTASPFGYRSARVDELADQALATPDPDVEDRVFRELMQIFRRDLPATFLFPWLDFVVVHRRLRGLSTPRRADPVEHMEDLWLEDRSD